MFKRNLKNKFGNKKTEVDGIKFDSKKEAEYYKKYKSYLDSGTIAKLELQVPFKYEIQYLANNKIHKTVGRYVADFVVTYNSGEIGVIDVKGFRTAEYKRKKKIIKKLYGIDIIEI
jgi:hypothetical protein